jgi:hypothetical protein
MNSLWTDDDEIKTIYLMYKFVLDKIEFELKKFSLCALFFLFVRLQEKWNWWKLIPSEMFVFEKKVFFSITYYHVSLFLRVKVLTISFLDCLANGVYGSALTVAIHFSSNIVAQHCPPTHT